MKIKLVITPQWNKPPLSLSQKWRRGSTNAVNFIIEREGKRIFCLSWKFCLKLFLIDCKFNLPLIGSSTWLEPPGPYGDTTCRERELSFGSHIYFFDHIRTWRSSPYEWSAQCRGHIRDSKHERQHTAFIPNKANMKWWLKRTNDNERSILDLSEALPLVFVLWINPRKLSQGTTLSVSCADCSISRGHFRSSSGVAYRSPWLTRMRQWRTEAPFPCSIGWCRLDPRWNRDDTKVKVSPVAD